MISGPQDYERSFVSASQSKNEQSSSKRGKDSEIETGRGPVGYGDPIPRIVSYALC